MAVSNRHIVWILSGVGLAMLGLGFASDPLYDRFCKLTGFGGTTGQADENLSEVIERQITVQFDSNVAQGLPWEFKPDDKSVTTQIGRSTIAYYTMRNLSEAPVIGVASFNVTPIKAAPYFIKTDCFCFTEQRLASGQSLTLPVIFYIDPEMDADSRLDEIKEITLSYTFFPSDEPVDTDEAQN